MQILISILFLVFILKFTNSHISFTYPPARHLPFDFLDNLRTALPCGVPKSDKSLITNFETGSRVNVSWDLRYPHKGGILIELLRDDGTLVEDLTSGFVAAGDPIIQQYEIVLPSIECRGCILRIRRQAKEWGKCFMFHSCSDINVVNVNPIVCSAKGILINGICSCDKGYFGQMCQFKDECYDDTSCSNHGKCSLLSGTSVPQKVCFCDPGWYGKECKSSTSMTLDGFDPSLYQVKDLMGKDFQLFWRIVDREIEFVLKRKGISWVAVGWRPSGLSGSCRNFPIKQQQINPKQATCEMEPVPEGETTSKSEPEPTSETEVTPISETAKSESEPEPESNAEPEAESEAADGLHAMDCTDIVIGMAKGNRNRVFDAYTRDRSTPMEDMVYGGSNSLTGAIASEVDGITTVMFRKPLVESILGDVSKSDQPIRDEIMHVIWAAGQNSDFSHLPKSGLEDLDRQKVNDFYSPDVLNYHGNLNRGVMSINFYQVPKPKVTNLNCEHRFSVSASQCGGDCSYDVMFRVNPNTNMIRVQLKIKMPLNTWSGIAFSSSGSMSDLDAIIVAVLEGDKIIVEDRYTKSYSEPKRDSLQNIGSVKKSYSNGIVTVSFNRQINTADTQDYSSECVNLIFPFKPATATASGDSFTMNKHTVTPQVSTNQYCFNKCDVSIEDDTPTSAEKGVSEEEQKGSDVTNDVAMKDAEDSSDAENFANTISNPLSRILPTVLVAIFDVLWNVFM